MNQQLNYINQYNQNAVNHNQMILEMQEAKLRTLMQDYDKLFSELKSQKKTNAKLKDYQKDAFMFEIEKERERNIRSREKDMQNLMILDKFQWTLGNGNNISFDNLLNMNNTSYPDLRKNKEIDVLAKKIGELKQDILDRKRNSNISASSTSTVRGHHSSVPKHQNYQSMNSLPPNLAQYGFNNNNPQINKYPPQQPIFNGIPQIPQQLSYGNGIQQLNPFQNGANSMLNMGLPQNVIPNQQSLYNRGKDDDEYEIDYRKNDRLLDTIERQNKLLENLASSIKQDKDDKYSDERKFLEKRIKQLEKMGNNPYSFFQNDKNLNMGNGPNGPNGPNQSFGFNQNGQNPYGGMPPYGGGGFPGMMPPFMSPFGGPGGPFGGPGGPFGPSPFNPMMGGMGGGYGMGGRNMMRHPALLKKLGLLGDDDDDRRKRRKGGRKGRRNNSEDSDDDDDDSESEESEDEETKKKRLEEEKKKLEELKKKKRDRNWRIFRTKFSFPILFFNEIKKKIEKKKALVAEKISDEINTNTNSCLKWITDNCGKAFQASFSDTKLNLNVVPLALKKIWGSAKNLAGKDLDMRVEALYVRCKMFIENLMAATKEESFTPGFLQFLASWTHDLQVPPQNFLFEFEINRLSFDSFALLKEMTPLKGQLIIAMFILLKILLFRVILRPFTMNLCQATEQIKVNTRMIASVLYLAIMDFFKGVLPINHNNQGHLPPELKIKARAGGALRADDTSTSPMGSPKKKDEAECFVGLFTQAEMEPYFKHKKNGFENLKALIEAWCGDIWKLVDKVWLQVEAKRIEDLEEGKKKDKNKAMDGIRKYERWQKENEVKKL